ncbi:MAG: hypothetical protein ABSG68_21530, partial [Thermoguttaceae bacterium]
FRYASDGHETSLCHRPAAEEIDQEQRLRWRLTGLAVGDPIEVTYRDGWRVVTIQQSVEDLSPAAKGAARPAPKAAAPWPQRKLFQRRTLADRTQWIGRYGGSAASERAADEGLAWLARHQAPDGFWANRCLGSQPPSMCEKGHPCDGSGEMFEMAHTGLALLAFQAGGHYYCNGAKYCQAVRRGLDWMVAHQRGDGGLIGSKQPSGFARNHKNYMYEHGIAAFALADACAAAAALGQPADDRYAPALAKAVAFIERNQHNDGGWRYTEEPGEPGDTSVSGWQVLALSSAREAAVDVDPRCLAKIDRFFRSCQTGANGRTGYQGRTLQTDATTGIGMAARQFLFLDRDAPLVRDAAPYLAALAEKSWKKPTLAADDCDYYLWYNCTLAMFQAGGDAWNRWNAVVRDAVVGLQRHDGCPRGSWDPGDAWGQRGGRIYSTALAILTLEVYYRYTLLGTSVSP